MCQVRSVFFFQAEDGIRDLTVTGVQTCALPISSRNGHWQHLNSMRILSMPDKWEYPWFAAWDLAFHTVALALVDAEFAKRSEERRVGKECRSRWSPYH